MLEATYPFLVYFHLLLFVVWLGADLGVFICGQWFRKRDIPLPERLRVLGLLVEIDMWPRTAWALMVPSSLSLLKAGGWWDVPTPLWLASLAIGAFWVWLVWQAHWAGQTPRAARLRGIENWLKYGLAAFYLGLGLGSLGLDAPLQPGWLAAKALLFGIIFLAAIMIDVAFRPVGKQLGALIAQGSSDATEVPLRRTMDTTRVWVVAVYVLLVMTSFLGTMGPRWSL